MVDILNRQPGKPRYLQTKGIWLRQTFAQAPPPSIGISWKTPVEHSTGAVVTASYDVLTGDIVGFPICTNTNFGDSMHVITKSSGTATINTPAQEILKQSGGQSSIHHCRVTGDGTIVFSISNPNGVRTVVRPVVLTGCHASDWVGAEFSEGSAVNDYTTAAIVSQAALSVFVFVDTEWNDLGDMTSTDLLGFYGTVNDAGGNMSGCFGHKVSTAAAENVTANMNAGLSSAADHDMCVVEFLIA